MTLEFSPIDKIFAEHFLSGEEKEGAAFLGYLLASARAGHLCVQESGEGWLPHPREIWPEADIEDGIMVNLIKKCLPTRLISSTLSTPVYRNNQSYYLQKNWLLETEAIQLFRQLLESKPEKQINVQFVDDVLQRYISENVLTPGQAKVIKMGCQSCLTIISGGPGTGKTYTAGRLISLLAQLGELEIVLAAPTGKAAARLQGSLQSTANIKAKTLHSLLGVKKTKESEPLTLSADVVLIDECSMIDIKMMVKLLGSLKNGARLIMLGDPCQLPPVESGSLFSDFVAYLSKQGKVAELTDCLRVENKELIDLARLVNQGDCQAALHLISSNRYSGDKSGLIEQIDAHYAALETLIGNDLSALQLFEKFRVLSPLRSGPCGVDSLNQTLHQMRLKRSCRYTPIILNRHAKAFDLFNGDTGLLVKDGEDYAIFERKGSEPLKIPAYLLPSYDLAYCLSVHKCQGSEYEEVFLVLPKGSQVFGRQALYTAITRAKKKLLLWDEDDLFVKMAARHYPRRSGVTLRL